MEANATAPRTSRARVIGILLERGEKEGRLRRLRVKVPMISLGVLVLVISVVGVNDLFAPREYRAMWIVFVICGIGFLLLSVLPTERRLVRVVSWIVLGMLALGTYNNANYVAQYSRLPDVVSRCTYDTPFDGRCWAHVANMAAFAACAAVWAAAAAHLAAALARAKSSRGLLDSVWRAVGCPVIANASAQLLADALGAPDGSGEPWAQAARGPVVLLFLFGGLGLAPRARAWLIGRLAVRGEASASGASISHLLGAGTPADVLRAAQERLRCVPGNLLRLEDIATDVIPHDTAERSRAAQLGEVDAFVSHSWRADPVAKLAALNAWCDEFRAEHGRWPLLWFDRYCVDAHDAVAVVMCLPVIIASCNSLLVLYDDTYLSRLWCVVEFGFFLSTAARHGGAVHVRSLANATAPPLRLSREPPAAARGRPWRMASVAVAPCPDATAELARAERAERAERYFDVRDAECVVPSDKEQLLALLDASPGGIELFNRKLPAMIAQALHAASGARAPATGGREDAWHALGHPNAQEPPPQPPPRLSRAQSPPPTPTARPPHVSLFAVPSSTERGAHIDESSRAGVLFASLPSAAQHAAVVAAASEAERAE